MYSENAIPFMLYWFLWINNLSRIIQVLNYVRSLGCYSMNIIHCHVNYIFASHFKKQNRKKTEDGSLNYELKEIPSPNKKQKQN